MGTLIDSDLETAGLRYDWAVEELRALHDLPLTELLYRAQTEHRRFHEPGTRKSAGISGDAVPGRIGVAGKEKTLLGHNFTLLPSRRPEFKK